MSIMGIASALKAAMKEYTDRDRAKYGNMDVSKVATRNLRKNCRSARI